MSLDFVYVDGYAHSGENGGKTIFDWHKKVKVGGILAGDDYHTDWPLVIEAVDQLIQQTGYNLQLTEVNGDDPYSQYPSWLIVKSDKQDLTLPQDLYNRGLAANVAELARRKRVKHLVRILGPVSAITPPAIKSFVRKIIIGG